MMKITIKGTVRTREQGIVRNASVRLVAPAEQLQDVKAVILLEMAR
jgi:hypothetical protein